MVVYQMTNLKILIVHKQEEESLPCQTHNNIKDMTKWPQEPCKTVDAF